MKYQIAIFLSLFLIAGAAMAQPDADYQERCQSSLEAQGQTAVEATAICQCLNQTFINEPALYEEAKALQALQSDERILAASDRYRSALAGCGVSRP